MNDSIARAKFIDKLMTAVFYCVAGFFILLLVAFALYVIINGFKDFSWSLVSFEGSGIGNLFFNTIYLVFLSLLVSVPLGVAAGIYMAERIAVLDDVIFDRTIIDRPEYAGVE